MPSTGSSRGKQVEPAPASGVEQENPFIVARDEAKVAKDIVLDRLLNILEPGDHIAATRKKGLYEHHGIYEGMFRGYPSVIHFQGPTKGSQIPAPCAKCGYQHPKDGGIVLTCLDCFSLGQNTYKLQYRLDADLLTKQDSNWDQLRPGHLIKGYRTKNYYLEHYKKGQLYGHSRVGRKWLFKHKVEDRVRLYKMFSSHKSGQEVLDMARSAKFRPYDLSCNNCEHFAVFCQTGASKSVQVNNFPIRIPCKRGKLALFRTGRCSYNGRNGPKNLRGEEQEYSKNIEATKSVEKEETVLLKSDENAGVGKPSKFDKILRKLF